jgi:hypothetical protein
MPYCTAYWYRLLLVYMYYYHWMNTLLYRNIFAILSIICYLLFLQKFKRWGGGGGGHFCALRRLISGGWPRQPECWNGILPDIKSAVLVFGNIYGAIASVYYHMNGNRDS